MEDRIVWIATDKIHPHPDNPRKDLGDLTELAHSIKKNGIMQNLTVIPDENGEYMALIGHRRSAAAKLVGVSEVPCVIKEGLSHKEQVAIMLEENMQRSDLTVYEQGQGFQMMLDLGATQEEIASKTGFSLSTIRRRLNVAKLDQELVKNPEFQITIADYAELEKVKSIADRNDILAKADNSQNLKWRIDNYLLDKKKEKNRKWFEEQFATVGIKEYQGKENPQWSSKYETLCTYRLQDEHPREDSIDLYVSEKDVTYLVYAGNVYVVKKIQKEKTEKKLSPEEIRRQRLEQNKKQLKVIAKTMYSSRSAFIKELIDGKIKGIKDNEPIINELMSIMFQQETFCSKNHISQIVYNKTIYGMSDAERDELNIKISEMPVEYRMLCAISGHIGPEPPLGWQGEYKLDKGLPIARMYAVLKKYGFSYGSEIEESIVDGSSELYEKEENKTNGN